MGAIDSLSAINSFIRTVLALVVIGGAGTGGYFAYTTYNSKDIAVQQKDKELIEKTRDLEAAEEQLTSTRAQLQQTDQELSAANTRLQDTMRQLTDKSMQLDKKIEEVTELTATLKLKEEELEQLAAAMQLLKVNHRIARLSVLDQEVDPDTQALWSTLEFVELNDRGLPIDEPKKFRVQGDVVYIDHWVVKFDDKYVEAADIDRATSLVLFRRVFGEFQEPNTGFRLDEVGARPNAYGSGRMTGFERKIWDDFWNIANDESKAQQLGIRAAHGEAPSIKVQKGKSYKVQLRASDGLSILPEESPPAPAPSG